MDFQLAYSFLVLCYIMLMLYIMLMFLYDS